MTWSLTIHCVHESSDFWPSVPVYISVLLEMKTIFVLENIVIEYLFDYKQCNVQLSCTKLSVSTESFREKSIFSSKSCFFSVGFRFEMKAQQTEETKKKKLSSRKTETAYLITRMHSIIELYILCHGLFFPQLCVFLFFFLVHCIRLHLK